MPVKKKNNHIINKLIAFFFAYSLLISIFNCEKKVEVNIEIEEKTDEIGVILTDNTVMRLDPIIYSSIVTYIGKGEKVKILKKSKVKTWLGDESDYWYMVRYSRGFLGWIYGKNIEIFSESDTGKIRKFLSRFWKLEMGKIRARLKGKWESIRIEGGDHEQYLLIYDDGKYVSYLTDQDVIKGQYRINYRENEIIFSNGTYFGKKINYLTREKRFYLIIKNGNKELLFKKITRKIENMEPGEEADNHPTDNHPTDNHPTDNHPTDNQSEG